MPATSSTASADNARIATWRLWSRYVRFALHLLIGLLAIPILPLLGARSARLTRWWKSRLLRILGVRVLCRGEPAYPALKVANHVSWLDIILLGSLLEVVFVSKAEVAGWPAVGRFARALDTVFIPRGAGQTSAISAELRSRMADGRSVLVFPEGTTTADPVPKRFHPRLFAPAIDGDYRVQPVAIRYRPDRGSDDNPGHHPSAPWVDEAALLPHFHRLMTLPRLDVVVTFCEPIDAAGHDRRGLAEASRGAIAAAIDADMHRAD